jgi:F0F1-type ATP synthase alpha subunit
VLSQRQFHPLSLGEEAALLLALDLRVLDAIPLERVDGFRAQLKSWLMEHCPAILALDDKGELSDQARAELGAALRALAQSLISADAATAGVSRA